MSSELQRLRDENARLKRLLDLGGWDTAPAPEQPSMPVTSPGMVTMDSSLEDKLALYADRFQARRDVYAVRWENPRSGLSGWSPAVAGGWRKGLDARGARYLPFTAEVLSAHLSGQAFVGRYPLTKANDCHFLVAESRCPGRCGDLPVGTGSPCVDPVLRRGPGKGSQSVGDLVRP